MVLIGKALITTSLAVYCVASVENRYATKIKGEQGALVTILFVLSRISQGAILPNMLYNKVEPQLLQAVCILSEVMQRRVGENEKVLSLKEQLATLTAQLDVESRKKP